MTSVEWQIILVALVTQTPSQVELATINIALPEENYGVFLKRCPQVSASLKQCSFRTTWTRVRSKSSLRRANNPNGLLDSWDIRKVKCTAEVETVSDRQSGATLRGGFKLGNKSLANFSFLFSSLQKKKSLHVRNRLFLSLLRLWRGPSQRWALQRCTQAFIWG